MEALRFALLGLATGGVYALLAQGLVLVYRGSGLLNFAQGAMAMVGAFAYYDVVVRHGLPRAAAVVIALLLCAALGALVHLLVLRPMRDASPLARVIATLGVLLVLQSAALVRYGSSPLAVPSVLPTRTVHVISQRLPLGVDRLYILVICLAASATLYAVYRWSSFGRVTTAVAENELAAASLGYSPDTVAAINWAVGSALAGLAGVLIAPIIFLEPVSLVLLVVPAMAVALVGGFSSFPVTLVAALALGVAQSEIQRYVAQPGWATAAPFAAIILLLVARGRALPLRSHVLDRLPGVGTGRVRPAVVTAVWAAGGWSALAGGPDWDSAMVVTTGFALLGLSIVLLTGYAGQLSLAQFVIAGVGALSAARLVGHVPLLPAILLAIVVSAGVGGAVGSPALRTRGSALAVATLGLGSALVAVVFGHSSWTGGLTGITVPPLSVLGWSIDPFVHPDRYAFVTLTVMLASAVMIANIRRGVTGRRLLAVRSNELAAASLGVPVAGMKAYAFVLSAGIAATGGILLAFVQPTVQVASFDVFTCILVVAATVTGGVGYVPGAILGAFLIPGGIVSHVLSGYPQANEYLPLIGGVMLTLTLITQPDGSFQVLLRGGAKVRALLPHRGLRPARRSRTQTAVATRRRVEPRALLIDRVSVSFGGVHALRDVTFDVRPGEVHGLIGPNGAGKTTLIDAVTGFARINSGTVRLGAEDVSAWTPRRRASRGLSRSFQTLELFDDLTVGENLAVASERPRAWRYLTDLVAPGHVRLNAAAVAAVQDFRLDDVLGTRPSQVSFGQRKLVALARAVAGAPCVLLLDEPAAGLDDTDAQELAALIRRLVDDWGLGVLLVEHRVDLIMAISDRITVLDAGRVLVSGTRDEVRADPRVLAAYLGTPTAV